MTNPMTPSLLPLSDLERSRSRSLRFQSLISRKGTELDPMLVLTINRKPYMASPMALSNLTFTDLERSKSRSLRFSVVGYLYGIDIFASSNITTIWMSQKSVCPSGLSCLVRIHKRSILPVPMNDMAYLCVIFIQTINIFLWGRCFLAGPFLYTTLLTQLFHWGLNPRFSLIYHHTYTVEPRN